MRPPPFIALSLFALTISVARDGEARGEAEESKDVPIHFAPPGCISNGGTYDVTTPAVYFEYFSERDGEVNSSGMGEGVLYDGRRWLLPLGDLNRYQAVRELVSQPESFERVVLHYDLPVLIGSSEIAFQYPIDVGRDWLAILESKTGPRQRYSSMKRVIMRLAQYRGPKGTRVLSLEPTDLADGTPIDTNLLAYIPERGVRVNIRTSEERASVYSLGRRLARGSRVVSELNRLAGRQPKRLLVHSGSVIERHFSEPVRDFCANALASIQPAAVVPAEGDLGIGAEALKALTEKYEIPYVAANLLYANDPEAEPPFPAYSLHEVDGLSVAIFGLVTPAALTPLPLSVRAEWTVQARAPAIEQTLLRIREELGRRPDLTVLLTDDPDERTWRDYRGIDVVIGDFSTDDRRYFSTVTKLIERQEGVSDASRHEIPVAVVRAGSHAVGQVTARYVPRAFGEPMRLSEVETNSFAVLEPGPVDESVEMLLRGLEEDALEQNAEVVLADPATALARNESLKSLVYGDRILSQDRFVRYSQAFPAAFTDALWMRLVTNIILLELETEVALSRNLVRESQTVGRVQRRYVDEWLRSADSVQVVNLTGSDLNKILARMRQQTPGGRVPPSDFIFAAGLDVETSRVRGRPVTNDQRYRVAVTDAVISLASDVNFNAYSADDRFVFRENGTFADRNGEPLLLRELILRNVQRKSAEANPIQQRLYLRNRLEDFSRVRDVKWTAALEELSIRGSRYVNNNAVGRLADSLQTRLTTDDNYNFDLRSRIRGTFDGPTLAWDNRLTAQLSQLVFDGDTGSDRQEPTDDIVLTTELRFNVVEVELLDLGFGITPFIQAVGDTEFTPTQAEDPNDSSRTIDNPRQALVRGLAGLVSQPSGTLREVRLGAVFEQDFSNDNSEVGLQASYELKWPIKPELTWESTLEARYFFPNSSDDNSSLGLIVQSVNRFLVPVGGWFDVYGYVDLYAARGKTDTTRQTGASWDIGAGIDVARLFVSSRARSVNESFLESLTN